MSTSSSKSFGLRQDFPFVRMFGFFLSIFTMAVMRSTIDKIVPSPYYSITNKSTGEDYIIFTDDAIWMLILMLFVIFLTLTFIIPIVLYFRGLSKWEWDPTTVVFWLIITWSLSFFFTEIAETNSSIEAYVLVLSKISDGLFVVFFTVFVLRTYSNYIVPLMSDWINIGKSDTQYGPLLDIIGSILIIVFGLTNFLSTFNVEFGVLVAGVGVVGLVIALAAQDTLSNFFSGILLLLDQGFKTGDMIYFNDTYCLIREIGLRSTKIYDIVNHVIIIIPNNALANQNILNLTKPDRYYRLRIEVGVSYDSNPDEVEAALLEVAKENSSIEQDDPTRKPLVRFQNFGDSTLNFALVAWIKNVIKMRQINSDLHHQVFAKLRAEKIVIAFPQRDVHLFHEGVPQAASENKKLNTNYEEPSEIVPENSISDEPNEVTELVEELPDILDETVNLDTDRDEENMAMTALMDELNLLRNEMNTINDKNKKSENEEIKSLKNQLSLMEKSFKESENEEIKSLKSQLSKMEENFRDSENEEINSLKQEISNLKADLMDKEDTDLDEDIDDSKSKKDEEDLAEAQRLIEEIQSRKFD
ncbi:MAG: mechanosensitive ion channel domain-containing protein [Candidatus Thermoplasmatota archaeon]|nr:mechanosensitive ion channel domain-containing protein [Candidatus Thermoplasmatota archaeon]MEC7493947.1 mechanosensitive ion channel domain-containing protein [Candidatus Thermoplasmatota archaeon]MEC7697832.1 mechanosensitive ion channel domain-containing protein [Candidatus Thermoplasmatota archaeon]MEC7976871.1 mechanosensitive ion channel domain-containing protein [Candidatus Thermoplasmatota archaeon]MEC8076408.1 mechanosensitive ion channel domain-containing protein [Candidatus Therm